MGCRVYCLSASDQASHRVGIYTAFLLIMRMSNAQPLPMTLGVTFMMHLFMSQ